MDHAQVLKFFEEFPFLNRHWTPFDFSNVQVKRWNEELLTSSGYVDYGYEIYSDNVYVFDEVGNQLLKNPPSFNLFKPYTWGKTFRAFGGPKFPFKKALKKLGDQLPKAYWAVRIIPSVQRPTLTLYKPPTNSVAEWLKDGRYLD